MMVRKKDVRVEPAPCSIDYMDIFRVSLPVLQPPAGPIQYQTARFWPSVLAAPLGGAYTHRGPG